MITIQLDIAHTVGIAAVLLVVGEFIKKRVGLLSRYFIPGPIIGGVLFSLIALVGYQTGSFELVFYDTVRFCCWCFLPPSVFRRASSC